MNAGVPYNPLDKSNLGKSVAEALIGRRPVALDALPRFTGAGIYALYYTGRFPAYSALATRNIGGRFDAPIYVGKAIPKGGRKGVLSGPASSERSLHSRLGEHAESVRAAGNLDIADFHCRFLVTDEIWIPLGESLLITKFAPIWNNIVDGFGNHDPGKGRHAGKRPLWDVLHPGRAWALKCADRVDTPTQIEAQVRAFLASTPLPASTHFLIEFRAPIYRVDGAT